MIDEYVKKWLIKAHNDLQVARDLISLPEEKRVTEAICFHCQQASEKFL
jgi:HEPN domain-containing protein